MMSDAYTLARPSRNDMYTLCNASHWEVSGKYYHLARNDARC